MQYVVSGEALDALIALLISAPSGDSRWESELRCLLDELCVLNTPEHALDKVLAELEMVRATEHR